VFKSLCADPIWEVRVKVAFIAFDGFLPWDLFHRAHDPRYAAYAGPWQVAICADETRISSYSGLTIDSHAPIAWAADADGVFVVSRPGSRAKLVDQGFPGALRLNPRARSSPLSIPAFGCSPNWAC
jgi:hypothetical protein